MEVDTWTCKKNNGYGGFKTLIVIDKEAIENVNLAMIFTLDCMNRMLGKTYVVENGMITEIHINGNVITGGKLNDF